MTYRTDEVHGVYESDGAEIHNFPADTVPLVNLTKSPWVPDLLTATITERLKKLGQSLGRAAKVTSRRQWQIAEAVNAEWAAREGEYRDEGITREMFLAACSQWLNACAGWSLLTGSGETLRRWCDVEKQFHFPPGSYGEVSFKDLRDLLSFDHFFRARQLYNAGDVTSPLVALEMAEEKGWTADEMRDALSEPPVNGWDYEHFARRLTALREGVGWLSAEDAAFVKAHLDAVAARLAELAGKVRE